MRPPGQGRGAIGSRNKPRSGSLFCLERSAYAGVYIALRSGPSVDTRRANCLQIPRSSGYECAFSRPLSTMKTQLAQYWKKSHRTILPQVSAL